MKKVLLILFLVAAASIAAHAYVFEVDGIYYQKLSGSNVEVTYKDTNYGSYRGQVIIPETVTFEGIDYCVTAIGDKAFYQSYYLTSVDFPNSLEIIKSEAFWGCSRLTSIIIPNSVTEIGNEAFGYCYDLESVTIGNAVHSIGESAFQFCEFRSIEVPNSVEHIGKKAFYGCDKLEDVVLGENVTYIPAKTFYGARSIEQITCLSVEPPGVNPDNNIFKDNNYPGMIDYITESEQGNGYYPIVLRVPENSIDAYKEAELWSNFITITSLGAELEKTSTPIVQAKITAVGNVNGDGIYNDDNVLAISIESVDSTHDEVFFWRSFLSDEEWVACSGSYEVYYRAEYDILPDSIDVIAISKGKGRSDIIKCEVNNDLMYTATPPYIYVDEACEGEGLKINIITDPIYKSYAFDDDIYHDDGIRYVLADSYVYQINGSGEWLHCEPDASIYLPEFGDYRIEAYGYREGNSNSFTVVADIHYDSVNCTSRCGNFIVHNGVVYLIESDSTVSVRSESNPIDPDFYLDYSGDIVIPPTIHVGHHDYTVVKIGGMAFCWTDIGITSVSIPNTVIDIGYYPFAWCSSLNYITVDEANPVYDSRENCNAIIETATNTLLVGCGNTVIPNTIESINSNSFEYNRVLTKIDIPNSVVSIGDYAFSYCVNLANLHIGNSVNRITATMFEECVNLVDISIDDGNPKYDSRDNCNAIIETASNTLIKGCNNTFIPNGVTRIGNRAFYECEGIKTVDLPNSVRVIEKEAFYGCENLVSIVLSETIDSIKNKAFSYCKSLNKIICKAMLPPQIERSSFYKYLSNVYETTTIFVPSTSLSVYKSHEEWGKFTHIVPFLGAGPGDINGDGSIAINDATNLIDMLLSGDELPAYADVNGDGVVTIKDVTDLIDMLLNDGN